MVDEKALTAAMEAYHPSTVGRPDRDRLARAIVAYLQALSPGSTGSAEGWHGPFGYLVCPAGLDESHWWISDDPVKDEGSFCLPVFTKEDPFQRTMIDAAGGRDE